MIYQYWRLPLALIDVCIRLKDKTRTFFAAEPQKCKYCKDGSLYVFDRHIMMDYVYLGECPQCKGTGLVH